MELQLAFNYIKAQFEKNLEIIKDYALKLKVSGNYKDYETHLIWDCIRIFVGTGTVCLWYKHYNCNDTHIEAIGKKVLKELGVI